MNAEQPALASSSHCARRLLHKGRSVNAARDRDIIILRNRARMCLFGVSLTLLPILVVKSPENPNFWGVNRRFQAKQAKYWKIHVMETNTSILTKFCTTIETIKNSSRVVQVGAQQIQDGGRPPFWKKPLNRYISAIIWPILIRFGTVTHVGLLQRIYG